MGSLLLHGTAISGTSTQQVGNCLVHLTELQHLEYSVPIKSEIRLPHMSAFAAGLLCLAKLKSLDLQLFACHLDDEVLIKFSSALLHLQALTSLTLNLWGSGITHEGLLALSRSVAYLHQLSTVSLDLSCNTLGAEGGLAFASQVLWPERLQSIEIDMADCHIGWSAVQHVVRSFFKLTHIRNLVLNLDDNGIGRSEWETLSGIRAVLLHRATCVKISCINHDNDDDDRWDEEAYTQLGFVYLCCG